MKQADIEKQGFKAALRQSVAPVDINAIGYKLKGIKRYAYRQHYRRHICGKAGEKLQIWKNKAAVFENAEQYKIDADRKPQKKLCLDRAFFILWHNKGKIPVRKSHTYKQKNIKRLAPRIKNKRKDKHYGIFLLYILGKKINQQIKRQKKEYKG